MPGVNPTAINFEPITAEDLDHKKDPSLGNLNRKVQQIVDQVNRINGIYGTPQFPAGIDLAGSRIQNVGTPVASTDALSQSTADPLYGAAVQQQNMEAVSNNMLQTTRRLNDGTQQHLISTDMNAQGTIPPTLSGSIGYTSTTTTITWTWTSLIIQYGDLSSLAIPDNLLQITGLVAGTTYYFYPYYDTTLGQLIFVAASNGHGVPSVAFSAPDINAAQIQNSDGKVPLSNGGMQGITPASGTGGGGGGGSGCKRGDMLVESRLRGPIWIIDANLDEEIRSQKRQWTTIRRKVVGKDRVFLCLKVSNAGYGISDTLVVTPADRIPLFGGGDKAAQDLCLTNLMRGYHEDEEVPLQIDSLATVISPAPYVLLSCYPDPEYMCGTFRPQIVGHNVRPVK